MIAIPIDKASIDSKSSKLFGNVDMFAIYEPEDERFFFIKNKESGNGVETAKLLKKWEVNSVVYSYMGDGPFKRLDEDDINVYYIGKEPLPLVDIVKNVQMNNFIKVDSSNSSTYLDPGTMTGSCDCGCIHE